MKLNVYQHLPVTGLIPGSVEKRKSQATFFFVYILHSAELLWHNLCGVLWAVPPGREVMCTRAEWASGGCY